MSTVKILETASEVRVMSEHVSFATNIDDIVDDSSLSIVAPLKKEQQDAISIGEKLRLTCVTDRGLYMFDTVIKKIYMRNLLIIYDLHILGNMRRVQRRDAFRARESVEVSIRKVIPDQDLAGKWVNTRTVDISEAGMLVKFNEECAVGQTLELVIRLKNHGLNEVLPKIDAKVIRCTATDSRQFGYYLGIRFTDVPEKARNLLLKLVVLSQRSKMTLNAKRKKII